MKKLYLISIIWAFSISAYANEINLSTETIKGKWQVVSSKMLQGSNFYAADGTDFWVFTKSKYTNYSSDDVLFSASYSIKGNKIVAKWSEYYGDHNVDEEYLIEVNHVLNNEMQAVLNGMVIVNLIKVAK